MSDQNPVAPLDPLTPEHLAELFARIARIERRLGLDGLPVTKVDPFPLSEQTQAARAVNAPQPAGQSPQTAAHSPQTPTGIASPTAPDVPPLQPPSIPHLAQPPRLEPRPEPVGPPDSANVPTGWKPPSPILPALPPRRLGATVARSIEDHADLERAVGGRWYAVAGALVLIAGVGLAFKWAYDAGLLRVSPLVRCLMGVAFGVALIVAGEWLHKRLSAWAGAGATAAGIGAIYVSTFVAYRVFDLLNAPTAFVLLAAVAAAGVVLSARSGLAAVGTISLVGGYITPFLFLDTPPRDFVMPLYLLMLLAVGLSLAVRKGGGFAALRITASIGTFLVGGLWAMAQEGSQAWTAIAFVSMAWAMLHAELWWNAKRPNRGDGPVADDGFAVLAPWRSLPISLGSTAWGVAIAADLLQGLGHVQWPAPALWAVAAGVVAFTLRSALTGTPATALSPVARFALLLTAQSAALVLITVASAFSGQTELAVWLGLASAASWTGRRIESRPIAAYGLIGLSIATLRLLFLDSREGPMHQEPHMVLGLVLTAWSAWMGAAATVWLFAAWMWSGPTLSATAIFKRSPRHVFANFALLLIALSVAHTDTHLRSAAIWLALLVVASATCTRPPVRLQTAPATMLLLAAASICWLLVYVETGLPWSGPGAMSSGFFIGLLVSACAAAAGWLTPREHRWSEGVRNVFVIAALVLAFACTSIEAGRIARALSDDLTMHAAGLSVWWGVCSIALLVYGFWRNVGFIRWSGLILLGLAGLKTVLIDLAGVAALPRVISFLGLGLIMILVPAIYSRLGSRLATRPGSLSADGPPVRGPVSQETPP